MYLVLSAYASTPVSLLATTKDSGFFFFFWWYECFHPGYLDHQHKPKADIYRLISSHSGLPKPC
jgi:hypothetical protein